MVNTETLHVELPVRLDYETVATRSSLLRRLRDTDDQVSWQVFFETYWRLIYNVARKSGLADADAQDVVQETVIAVAKRMPQFTYDPARGSFKQWLLLVTRRRIHDHLRRVYRGLQLESGTTEEITRRLEQTPAPTLTADAEIDAAWEQEWKQTFFQAALVRVRQKANPIHYQAFDHCALQGLPVSEAARMLGLTAAQVYLAKHRVGRAVKRALVQIEAELAHSAPRLR